MERSRHVKTARGGVSRRELLQQGVGLAAMAAVGVRAGEGAPPPFELEETTLAELQAALSSGRHTARSLAEAYLGRIAALDGRLRSVIEVNPDIPAVTEALDRERREKGPRGPLHGIPVLVKDNIDTADGMMTTAGSYALAGARPPRDAFLIQRLRAAGAVVLGKANLSEWANFRSNRSSSGWSGRGGQCANPYALDRSPCGSSSGSAAAVSGNLAPLAVGTETDGSVVCPSATCGIVGIKPTLGLISRSGIVPISHNQDTAGPMARSVADAATLLAVLAGRDPRDEATAPLVGKPAVDYTSFLVPGGLKGARIGVPRARFFGYSPDADAVAEEALEVMKREGAVLVDPADIPHAGDYDDEEFTVLLYDFKADLNAYLAALGPDAPVHSLADVIAFNAAHRLEEMPYFGQETMVMAEDKGPLTDEKYVKALEKCRRLARQEGIDAVMEKLSLDALVAPTGAPAWTIDLVNGDHYLGSSSTPAAVSGYPSITVPAGYAFGLPVGVSFIGRPWSEGPLIRLAHAFETAAQARRRPRFLATADLGTGRAT